MGINPFGKGNSDSNLYGSNKKSANTGGCSDNGNYGFEPSPYQNPDSEYYMPQYGVLDEAPDKQGYIPAYQENNQYPASLNNYQEPQLSVREEPLDLVAMEEEERKEMIKRITPMAEEMIFADNLINRGYLSNLHDYEILKPEKDPDFADQMNIFKINRLIYEEGEDINEKLVSVYGALHNINSRVFLILDADEKEVSFYIGVAVEKEGCATSLAGSVLEDSIKGNFPGSIRKDEKKCKLSRSEIKNLMERLFEQEHNGFCKNKNDDSSIASVTMIPSERNQEKGDFVQGLEKLIDALQGKTYTAIFLAVPLTHNVIDARKSGLEYLYSTLSPLSKTSFSYGENVSQAVSEGISQSFSNSINISITDSNSQNHSVSTSVTKTKGSSFTKGHSTNSGMSSSSSDSDFMGGSSSSGINFGESDSVSRSTSSSVSKTEGVTSGESFTHSVSTGQSVAKTDGKTESFTNTLGENRTFSINYENKSITGMMEHIDEHLKRIKICESFGLWECSAYFISEASVAMTAASMYRSLMTGETSQIEKSFVNFWDKSEDSADRTKVKDIMTYLMQGYHPLMELPANVSDNSIDNQLISPAAMVSGKELPLLLSFPRESVAGIMVDSIASFGRSVILAGSKPKREIELGRVIHKGEIFTNNTVKLDLDQFTSHCFITGSTGSGKSNTTSQLICEFYKNDIPFLVIEPAKGEYKFDFGNLPGINIFWTNPNDFQMLHLNPFRFPEEIHVLEHLDRLIEMFSACWPLTAAMPSILKDTMERAYEVCGWDMAKSICLNPKGNVYPTFSVLLEQLYRVIDATNYSSESKGDYKGALGTRIGSLTKGIMGQVFCSDDDIHDEELFDTNTIVDLSRVGSAETKSLIMGIIIMKLNEYRSAKSAPETQNSGLRHITILEEAHNLLRRISSGGSEVQAKSIEMISNGIAEMRTYGEGFLIVDQSPTAVDISAIKNTNTKIVMRLPEEADFTTIGGAFALNENQIREIPRLGKGEAIVSQSGWLQPLLTKVNYAGDTVAKWKYNKKPVNYNAVRKTLATILVELCNQIETGKCGTAIFDMNGNVPEEILSKYQSYLAESTLTIFKQREMLDKIRRYLSIFEPENTNNKMVKLGKMCIEMMDCEGLFRTISLQFEKPKDNIFTEEDAKKYKIWRMHFYKGMDSYVSFGKKEDKLHVYSLMCLYKTTIDQHFNKLKRTGKL